MSIQFSKSLIPVFALGMGMQIQSGQSSFLQTPPSAEEIASDTLDERKDVSPIESVKSLPGVVLTGSEVTTYTSSLFVRGSSGDHTLFIWNDFRSDNFTAPTGATDPFGLASEFSNRIRVLKGPQSLLYGTQALGGVVLVEQDPDLGSTLELSGGSLNTSRGLGEARARGEKWQLAVGGSAFSTEGVSTYDAAVPRGSDGDLERDGRQKSSASAIVSFDLPSEDQLQFMVNALRDTLSDDVPPLDDVNAHSSSRALQWKARYKVNWGDRADSVFLVVNQDTDRENNNPVDAYDSSYYFDHAKGQRSIFLNRNSFVLLKSLWQVGLEASQEEGHFDSSSDFDPAGSSFDPTTSEQNLYVVNDWNFESSDFSWGVRGSCQKSEDCLAVYQVSYQWHWVEAQRSLYGIVSTGLKRPSLYQQFSVQYGDQNLQAETSQAYEVGVVQRWGAPQRAKISFFENQFSNLIDYDFGVSKYKNLKSAKTKGIEFMHQYDAVMWDTQFSIAQIYAKDETTGQYLLRRPALQGAWELGYDIYEPLRVAGELLYLGDREDSVGASRVVLDAVTLLNLSLTYKRNFAQYFLRVNNAGNSFYEDIKGYLTPGRFVWLGMKLHF
ncbi:TonB-dependent receptor plug domain-containing protein [Bdellovibrio sp. HCB337]|uniref:TonB-dependent receptor plug domain-containing protein n=1 Tax=Bdellovibrio sp. HCB337 TaxID=3394358 RepID=UPI0039A411B0